MSAEQAQFSRNPCAKAGRSGGFTPLRFIALRSFGDGAVVRPPDRWHKGGGWIAERSLPWRRLERGRNSMKSFVRGLLALLAMLCLTFDGSPALSITGYMSVLTMSHEGSWGVDTQISWTTRCRTPLLAASRCAA